jgi:hypothetical protein
LGAALEESADDVFWRGKNDRREDRRTAVCNWNYWFIWLWFAAAARRLGELVAQTNIRHSGGDIPK